MMVMRVPPSSDGTPADTLRYRMVADGPVKVLQLLPLHAPPVGQPLRSNYMDDGVLRLNLRLSLASFGLSSGLLGQLRFGPVARPTAREQQRGLQLPQRVPAQPQRAPRAGRQGQPGEGAARAAKG